MNSFLIGFILSLAITTANGDNHRGNFKKLKHIYPKYKPVANSIIDNLLNGPSKDLAYNRLAYITDTFGNRMTGSSAFDKTVDFLVQNLTAEGFDVHTETAEVPGWQRGYEFCQLISPIGRNMTVLGLGFTVPTEPGGLTAEAVVVRSFDELKALGSDKISGKIVVFNEPWVDYGTSVEYRENGASEAAKYGAKAALIRSVASKSVYSPHTGMQGYQDGITPIPAVSITVEDAEMLHRMYLRGETIKIFLRIDSHPTDPVISRNTIVDLKGWERPNEVVLISGHLDSWDVGWGAMDDGGGMIISWTAMSVIKALKLRPRRTIRAIFWTGEEQGHVGSQQYHKSHNRVVGNETFQLVMESDMGAFRPFGLNFTGSKGATVAMRNVVELLKPIGANHLYPLSDGGDVQWWMDESVPGGSIMRQDRMVDYFTYHHTQADNVVIYSPDDLNYSSALWAVVAYVVADMQPSLVASMGQK